MLAMIYVQYSSIRLHDLIPLNRTTKQSLRLEKFLFSSDLTSIFQKATD